MNRLSSPNCLTAKSATARPRSGVLSILAAARVRSRLSWPSAVGQTTGVDNVPTALEVARQRARDAGLDLRFIQGDATALRASGAGEGFRFFLDIGCFHGLNDSERKAMGREVTAAAAPDATMLLLATAPGSRGPLPRGASQADIETAFPGWKVLDVDAPSPEAVPKPLRSANPRFYRLGKGRQDG